jgi:hypothetical protein
MTRHPEDKTLDRFISAYTPAVATIARDALARLRRMLPGAIELVYDNYNALAIGFGPTERTSDVICSLALYPRYVSLFLMHGATLPDPEGVLEGSGKQARHVKLRTAADLDRPEIRALITQAVSRADPRLDDTRRRRIIIRSVSKKQRPRRPAKNTGER